MMKEILNISCIKFFLIAAVLLFNVLILNGQQVEVIGDFKAPLVWADGAIQEHTIFNDGFEDMTLSPFTTSGDSDWTTDNLNAYVGTYSAISGPILPGESSSIHLTVVVPEFHTANLSFATKSSIWSTDNSIYIDGVFGFSVTSTDVWTTFEKELSSGTHNLEWRLDAFSIFPLGQQLRLDAVKVTYLGDHVVRIQDGNQGLGKILTSDQSGNATWEYHNLIHPNPVDNNGFKILYPDDPNDPNCIFDSSMASGDGVFVMNSLSSGFESRCSGGYGFNSSDAGSYGFRTDNSAFAGFLSSNSGSYGFQTFDSTDDGFHCSNSGNYGFYTSNSTDLGFYSLSAGSHGFYSWGSANDGFYSSNNSNNGFTSLYAGNDGIYSNNSAGDEGYFSGTVVVTGNLSKGGGSFKIDHPLDPENKFLYHSFVESPDMMNVYNGNIVTDQEGLAKVEMPDWFETLNRDFRYQLTVIGVFAQAIIKEKLEGNQFVIQTDLPNVEVSWQITGIRQDPYANNNRIEVEVDKSAEFRGQYIHPEAYSQPFEKGFDYIKLGRKTLEELEAEHKKEAEK